MIKIIKKRRNPNLKGKEFIDDNFIRLLADAIIYNTPKSLSHALVYKNIGNKKCSDCKYVYEVCRCEGDRELENRECRKCWQNYCLCDYGIDRDYQISFSSYQDRHLTDVVINIAKKYLSSSQKDKLRNLIVNTKDTDFIITKKNYEELIEKLRDM